MPKLSDYIPHGNFTNDEDFKVPVKSSFGGDFKTLTFSAVASSKSNPTKGYDVRIKLLNVDWSEVVKDINGNAIISEDTWNNKNMEVDCGCPNYRWNCYQGTKANDANMYTDKEVDTYKRKTDNPNLARNPNKELRMCKHLYSLVKAVESRFVVPQETFDMLKQQEAMGQPINAQESIAEFVDRKIEEAAHTFDVKEGDMTEDSFKHTLKQLDNNDLSICFITAYTSGTSERENRERNEELEMDLSTLGYKPEHVSNPDLPFSPKAGHTKTIGGFKYTDENDVPTGEIGHEPGFKVVVRNINPNVFKEEMLALGKKYGQWSILLKLPEEPAAYYHTHPANPSKYGQIDTVFKGGTENVNPADQSTFKYGYTQLRKDKNKHPDRAFQYIEASDFDIKESSEVQEGRLCDSGNWHMACSRKRAELGLTPQSKQ